jgi:hypothetical protein
MESLSAASLHARGNQTEALLWLLFAVGFAWYALRQSGARRRRCVVTCIAFFFFAVSDLVEIRTGAWWRPWWLLVWKLACVATMFWLLIQEFRPRGAADQNAADTGEPPGALR